MSVKVASNRLIVSSLQAGFYQQLLSNVSSFKELGNRLVRQAETVLAFRQFDKLEELGLMLLNHPIKEYQLIGQFYLGWCAFVKGEDAQGIFERVAEYSLSYKARAFISLAPLEALKNNYEAELGYYRQAVSVANNPTNLVEATRGIAVVKSKEGYNQSALKELERVMPLTKYVSSKAYYAFLNSLAVELGEVGRIEEAQNVCKIVLASPFAFAYPEWRETGREIALRGYKSRSVVSLTSKRLENVLSLPEREASDAPIQQGRARVFDYLKWKKQMVKEPNGEDENIDEMDFSELIVKLLQLTAFEGANEYKVRKIVKYAEEVMNEKD